MELERAVLIVLAWITGVIVFVLASKALEMKDTETRPMTPDEEREFELEPNYASSTEQI